MGEKNNNKFEYNWFLHFNFFINIFQLASPNNFYYFIFLIHTDFVFILQARALTAQTAETENIRFLVGTQSLRAENQVILF